MRRFLCDQSSVVDALFHRTRTTFAFDVGDAESVSSFFLLACVCIAVGVR